VTSGFDLELGMTGLELSADSLASIARGGIAFITPQSDRDEDQVQTGDVFPLHEKVDQEWIESASAVNLLSRELPEVGRIEAAWKQKSFGFTRRVEARGSALLVREEGSAVVLAPADLSVMPDEAIEGTFQLTYGSQSSEFALEPLADQALVQDERIQEIARLPVDLNLMPATGGIAGDRIRIPVSPEDCFAVRSSWHRDQDSAVVIEMIGKHELRADDGVWAVSNSNLNREMWHGAVVIASHDESMIGMLVVVDDMPMIVPVSPLDAPTSTY
jgi:paraquat-inducible protein B